MYTTDLGKTLFTSSRLGFARQTARIWIKPLTASASRRSDAARTAYVYLSSSAFPPSRRIACTRSSNLEENKYYSVSLPSYNRSDKSTRIAPISQPLFERIRVREQEDFHRLYSLILEYTDHPERAEHVTEIVFRTPLPIDYHYTKYSEDGQPREDLRDVSKESAVRRAIRHLNLSPEDEMKWVRSLSW